MPAPTQSKSSAFAREGWNARYAKKELVWSSTPNRTLESELADLPPGEALDLAAGEGRNGIWLAERGWRVTAVDFADQGLAKARKIAEARGVTGRMTFEVADLLDYIPTPGRYDLVAMMYFQIPRANLPPVLRRAAEAVAPGGTFFLVAHDSENLEHGVGGPKDPDVLYTADFVTDALGGMLHIETAARIERQVQGEDGVRMALDCLVRGRRQGADG